MKQKNINNQSRISEESKKKIKEMLKKQ